MSFASDFGPFDDRIWLNCAHQGPLPRRAAEEALEAVAWKRSPRELTQERFSGLPVRTKKAIGRIIGADALEIVLGNSASYGLHLLANGFPWRDGDEVLLVRGDFPSDLLPWLGLARRGVQARFVEPERHLPTADELEEALTDHTRVFCSTWVHSFSGVAADLDALGAVCRRRGVTFVVNASQAVGARPLSVHDVPVDAVVSVGFKWLCGPYGTGFCWMQPTLLEKLELNQAYWQAQMTAADLANPGDEIALPDGPPTARTFDVMGTANFFNFKPWAAALEYLAGIGIDVVAEHDRKLVGRFLRGIDRDRYRVLSPEDPDRRSTLVFVTHHDPDRNTSLHAALAAAGIDVALRRGSLRIAPHLYNTTDEIDRALAVLNSPE